MRIPSRLMFTHDIFTRSRVFLAPTTFVLHLPLLTEHVVELFLLLGTSEVTGSLCPLESFNGLNVSMPYVMAACPRACAVSETSLRVAKLA